MAEQRQAITVVPFPNYQPTESEQNEMVHSAKFWGGLAYSNSNTATHRIIKRN